MCVCVSEYTCDSGSLTPQVMSAWLLGVLLPLTTSGYAYYDWPSTCICQENDL